MFGRLETSADARIPTAIRVQAETPLHYTRTAILLHWIAALLIACNFVLGLSMVDLPFGPQKFRWYGWHKWTGITVFLVTLLRLLWRTAYPAPPAVAMPDWQRKAARATHLLLYGLMLVIPLSGWLYSSATGVSVVYLGLVPLPDLVSKDKALAEVLKAVHVTLNFTLLALVFVHTGAAFKHHLVDRDGVLVRMVPFLRRSA
jgi:cytochrome b561